MITVLANVYEYKGSTDMAFFSSALADDRCADTDCLEPIFGADTAFAPLIYIIKMTQ